MLELENCLTELSGKIQAQEKLQKMPKVIGMRVIDGPWDKTKFLDVETVDKTYSALLVQEGCTLKMVAPFKVSLKDNVLKK